jgi:hypothetical protein
MIVPVWIELYVRDDDRRMAEVRLDVAIGFEAPEPNVGITGGAYVDGVEIGAVDGADVAPTVRRVCAALLGLTMPGSRVLELPEPIRDAVEAALDATGRDW